MPPKNNKLKADDVKWSERTARLRHRFLVLRKLGQGTYGKVQLALNKETNQEVAIKTIKKAKIESEEDMLRIRREIHIMTSIRHPHVIHINEVFETRQKIVLVMQYANGGELYDYLGCHNTLPEKEARRIFRQIASAIYYCHKNKICHRDLKLENILLDEEGNAQIADFGLSNIFDERRRMNTFCGSPLYASPEIVKGIPYTGPEVDCWSLGVLLYILIYGTMPFDGRNFKELVSQISEGRYNEPITKSRASGLIRRLLTPDISRRATIYNVCEDDWVNLGCDESLNKIAEEMSMEALLKTNKQRLSNILLDNDTKTENKTHNSQTELSNSQHQKEAKTVSIDNEALKNSLPNNVLSSKATLYEQMLSYDVSFVLNKLLVAVESALTYPKVKRNVPIPPTKDNIIPAFKHWPRNGESNLPTKVESAYVIPIFEVTSVIPKSKGKSTLNHNNKENSMANTVQNVHTSTSLDHQYQKELKDRLKIKNNKSLNQPLQLKQLAAAYNNTLSQTCAETNPQQTDKTLYSEKESSSDNKPTEPKHSQENNHRTTSNKLRRTHENHLFGQKQFGTFFRNRNQSLSLARIFSMKYEELILKTFNAPQRKQRSPGKIVIPATFDPSSFPSTFQDKKEVLVFPTVSVSENKERIEKKIDRIKKAALNMNLIRRSNSKNRLRIQKYLKSQTKKIQDLVHDDHRSIASSLESINVCEMFPAVSDSYFNKFNFINIKHHNKKMNFMYLNAASSYNPFASNIPASEKWKLTDLENTVFGQGQNLGFSGIAKSKSDIQFSSHYDNYSSNENCIVNHSTDKAFNCFLNVPNTECQLLRSASASEALFKSAPDIFVSEELNKNSELNACVNSDQINQEILKEYFYIESEKLNDLFKFKMSYLNTQPSKSIDKKTNFMNQLESKVRKCTGVLIGRKETYRSKSADCCVGYSKMNKSFKVKRIASASSVSSRKISNEVRRNEIFLNEPMINRQVREKSCGLTSNVLEKLNRKLKLVRQNTMSVSSECNGFKLFPSQDHTRRSSEDSDTGFEDYFWSLNDDDQEYLLSQQNNQMKFLSSPNLCLLRLGKKAPNELVNESRSVDCLSMRRNEMHQNGYETLANHSSSCLRKSDLQPYLNRRILQSDDSAFCDFSSNNIDRTNSISEDTLANFEIDELLRRTQNERKISLPPGIAENPKKTQFLSKFLNELENRQQFPNSMNKNSNHRNQLKNPLLLEKRPKLQKRSQSFLQLLSLKRIQEAEKELERAERSSRLEAKNDESGSLLEALKTHGYKGVISQLFQGTEDDSLENSNLRNPKGSYFKRQISNDLSHYNPISYESLPFLPMSTYEDDDLGIQDTDPIPSFYDMYPGYRQNYQKQLVYNWLATNQNGDYLSQYKTDSDAIFEPERTNQQFNYEVGVGSSYGTDALSNLNCLNNLQPPDGSLYISKQRTTSFDEETSPVQTLKDQYTNGGTHNDLSRARENSLDDDSGTNAKCDRNVLSRTSSASEEEKESVHDRIWRKSFYSRFNNSVLSKKERPTFLKSLSTEGRTGIRDNFLTSCGVFSPQGTEYAKEKSHKDSELKRIHHLTKSYTTNGIAAGSVKSLKSKSGKHVALKRTESKHTLFDEDI